MKYFRSIVIAMCVVALIIACDKKALEEDSVIVDVDNEPALLFSDQFETLDTNRWHFHSDYPSRKKTALYPFFCNHTIENSCLNVYAENEKGHYGGESYGATSVAYLDLLNLHLIDSIRTDFTYLFIGGLSSKFEMEILSPGFESTLVDTSFFSLPCDTLSYSLPIDLTEEDTVRVRFTVQATTFEGGQLRLDDIFIYGMRDN